MIQRTEKENSEKLEILCIGHNIIWNFDLNSDELHKLYCNMEWT